MRKSLNVDRRLWAFGLMLSVLFALLARNIVWAADVDNPAVSQIRDETSWCLAQLAPTPTVHLATGGNPNLTAAMAANMPAGWATAAGAALAGTFDITQYDVFMLEHTKAGAGFVLDWKDGTVAGAPAH